MAILPIIVTDEHNAGRAVGVHPDWALISIRNKGLAKPLFASASNRQLYLEFDDIESVLKAFPDQVAPNEDHAGAIIAFARSLLEHEDADGGLRPPAPGLIVHCAAGISRSSATVLGVLATLGHPNPLSGLEEAGRYSIENDFRWETSRGLVGAGAKILADAYRKEPLALFSPNRRLLKLLDRELDNQRLLTNLVREHYYMNRYELSKLTAKVGA